MCAACDARGGSSLALFCLHIRCETGTLSFVYGDTLSGCLLRDIILPSSFLRPTFSIDLSIGDRVFYTRSNGLRAPATVVGTAKDGLLHLEYYQDGLRVVNRQCKMESISFAIPSSDSPPHCPPSLPPNTQPSSPPKAPSLHHRHKNIVHRVRSYLNGVVAEVRWAERLSEWNHVPHFPFFVTHYSDSMPIASIGGILCDVLFNPKYAGCVYSVYI